MDQPPIPLETIMLPSNETMTLPTLSFRPMNPRDFLSKVLVRDEEPVAGPSNAVNGASLHERRTREPESSHASGPVPEPESTPERTRGQVMMDHMQLFAACWAVVLAGWNDGTTGPLLPRIQQVYDVNYTIVSMLFVCASIGFVVGALINVPLSERLGFGKLMVLGSGIQAIAYAIDAAALPFPVLCIGYAINGSGMAILSAQSNGYVASLKDEAKMGMLHAAYGFGALVAPLVSTQFSQVNRWSFHYLTSMGLALSCVVLQIAVLRFRTFDECMERVGRPIPEKGASTESNLKQIFRLKNMHTLAAFALIYTGVEATLGGWIVSYIIDERGGGANSGYISSGFFAGLMIGRLLLLWVNEKVGEWFVIFLYSSLAIGLELVVWLVPSLIGNAIAVSIVGIVLGPFFPIAMNQAARIFPAWLLTPSIGWIASVGQAGSAVLPFITGALAQTTGIGSLQPFLVSMMGLMMLLWAMVPRKASHRD
ncbi:major facilitator superfamily domain-containing protein [Schizophyllum amplum]|uniref:Major facilitator superfamily domain-containing protein n=1 Tax=Schizophyllum amplum TaxID=97359 RepID=A0A550CGK6_9AGAR|nr:major facilitator superfamily domain-containing protein [Auriculariopsis ampla]